MRQIAYIARRFGQRFYVYCKGETVCRQ
jgi:hypothetical protein